MKQLTKHAIAALSAGAFVIFAASSAQAVDHNNIDANRPLSFDDWCAKPYRFPKS